MLTTITIVFLVLKLAGVIAWSWWLVALPFLIEVGLVVLWSVIIGTFAFFAHKKV